MALGAPILSFPPLLFCCGLHVLLPSLRCCLDSSDWTDSCEDALGWQVPSQIPRQDRRPRRCCSEPQEIGTFPSPPFLRLSHCLVWAESESHLFQWVISISICPILIGFRAGLPPLALLWTLWLWQENPNHGSSEGDIWGQRRKGSVFFIFVVVPSTYSLR